MAQIEHILTSHALKPLGHYSQAARAGGSYLHAWSASDQTRRPVGVPTILRGATVASLVLRNCWPY